MIIDRAALRQQLIDARLGHNPSNSYVWLHLNEDAADRAMKVFGPILDRYDQITEEFASYLENEDG